MATRDSWAVGEFDEDVSSGDSGEDLDSLSDALDSTQKKVLRRFGNPPGLIQDPSFTEQVISNAFEGAM